MGDEVLEKMEDRRMHPGAHVRAIGDRADLEIGEHALRRLRVAAGDAVGVAREAEGEPRHVEAVPAGEQLELFDLDQVPDDAADVAVIETVVSGLHRRVRGEHAFLADGMNIVLERFGNAGNRRDAVLVEQRQAQERGVALVEVVGLDPETERAQHTHPADAEYGFLLDAVALVAEIEPVGDGAVARLVLGHIGVEQDDRNLVSVRGFQLVEPGPDPDRPAFDVHRHHGADRGRVFLRVPRIGRVDLVAVAIDFLAIRPFAGRERHENDGKRKIRRRAGRVAGEKPKTSRIGMHFGPDADFHGEISDPIRRQVGLDLIH